MLKCSPQKAEQPGREVQFVTRGMAVYRSKGWVKAHEMACGSRLLAIACVSVTALFQTAEFLLFA